MTTQRTELTRIDPASLRIELYPTEALKTKASALDLSGGVSDELRAIALRMVDLMRGAQGIGLAAPQVGISHRLFVAHVPPDPEGDPDLHEQAEPGLATSTEEAQVFINPRIVEFSRDLEPYDEGCLSLPGITGEVNRPTTVTMHAFDLDGHEVTLRATGLLARCWQHEIDHLDGVLIIDRMTQMSRLRNRSKIRSMEKAAKR